MTAIAKTPEGIEHLKWAAHAIKNQSRQSGKTHAWSQYHHALQAAYEAGNLVFRATPAPTDNAALVEAAKGALEELCRIDCEGITETRNESDVLERVRFFASRGAENLRAALASRPAAPKADPDLVARLTKAEAELEHRGNMIRRLIDQRDALETQVSPLTDPSNNRSATAGLVERLREADKGYEPGTLFTQAADALTAMQARLDDVTAERDAARNELAQEATVKSFWKASYGRRKSENAALQEQLTQAREALQSIVDVEPPEEWQANFAVRALRQHALAALTPSPTRSTEDGA